PANEQRALATGAVVAGGFGVTAWLAALIGRITLVAYVGPNRDRGWFSAPPAELRRSVHGIAVVARPDPGSVLGLGLLWGLIGGVGAAAVWAVRRRAPAATRPAVRRCRFPVRAAAVSAAVRRRAGGLAVAAGASPRRRDRSGIAAGATGREPVGRPVLG